MRRPLWGIYIPKLHKIFSFCGPTNGLDIWRGGVERSPSVQRVAPVWRKALKWYPEYNLNTGAWAARMLPVITTVSTR